MISYFLDLWESIVLEGNDGDRLVNQPNDGESSMLSPFIFSISFFGDPDFGHFIRFHQFSWDFVCFT